MPCFCLTWSDEEKAMICSIFKLSPQIDHLFHSDQQDCLRLYFNTFCKDNLSRDPERTSLAHCLQSLYELSCIILNPTEIVRCQTVFKQRTTKGLGITDDWNDGFSRNTVIRSPILNMFFRPEEVHTASGHPPRDFSA